MLGRPSPLWGRLCFADLIFGIVALYLVLSLLVEVRNQAMVIIAARMSEGGGYSVLSGKVSENRRKR